MLRVQKEDFVGVLEKTIVALLAAPIVGEKTSCLLDYSSNILHGERITILNRYSNVNWRLKSCSNGTCKILVTNPQII